METNVILKGGSWLLDLSYCSSANCDNCFNFGARYPDIGFRLFFIKIKHDKDNH